MCQVIEDERVRHRKNCDYDGWPEIKDLGEVPMSSERPSVAGAQRSHKNKIMCGLHMKTVSMFSRLKVGGFKTDI